MTTSQHHQHPAFGSLLPSIHHRVDAPEQGAGMQAAKTARRNGRRAEVPPSRVRRMPQPLASNPPRFREDRSEIAHDIARLAGVVALAASGGSLRWT
jgi:hypothetical protein